MGRLTDHDLNALFKKYNLNIFVETGTFKGFGIESVQSLPFEELHSCEFLEEWSNFSKKKFENDERVKIYNSESQSFLDSLLKKINSNKNCLFWLDAHYPGKDPYYQKNLDSGNKIDYGEYDFDVSNILLPLKKELALIRKYRSKSADVIICDDARVYTDCICDKGSCGDEIPLPSDRSMEWYKQVLIDTHDFNYIPLAGGYFVYTPKH
jgi:hypothetical protein